MLDNHHILIIGAAGYIGRLLFDSLRNDCEHVYGIDIRADDQISEMDVRDPALAGVLREHEITHVVHLASIVQPGQDAELEYDIDVNGTKNVLDACVAAGVKHLTVTSSGAAYGYHADNPEWLTETDPLRGNDEFSYSRHKRLVEEMLAEYRQSQRQLGQLVLRPGTVLGASTNNRVTKLFTGRRVIGLRGVPSPFVFVWDQDLVGAIRHGVENSLTGVYNVAGDGCVTVTEIGQLLGKPVRRVPVWLMKAVLGVGKAMGLTQYSPDQVMFMQYRPVLSNQRLKSEFGFVPEKTSREVLVNFSRRSGSDL